MLMIENINFRAANGNGLEEVHILKDVNLKLEDNKFYAITGPNGGGKTSLAKAIMGIYDINDGRILFDDMDITRLGITERAKMGIAYAFQSPPRFKGLKVEDLLRLSSKDKKLHPYRLRAVGLCPQDYLQRDCDLSLSGGEMKRIELATVLSRDSRIIIYDEPEAGVDLWSFENLLGLIRKYHLKGGVSSIVITHHERVLSLADEIILMVDGKVKRKGSREEMINILKEDMRCEWKNSCGGTEFGSEFECC
ncbi:MAG: ATP-binding cassette domain-containing protein [Thermoanaerobacterales bacterium]|nr:ATP-binding cassette domain-containing protein [Thermoanaerobacterales bacterium]